MQLFAKPFLTWYEPPVLAEVYQRLHQANPLCWSGRKALAFLLVLFFVVLGPLPVLRAWIVPPSAAAVRFGEGILLALVVWSPFAIVYVIGTWLARKGIRLCIPMRCYAHGRRSWLEIGLTRVRCTAIREYIPVRIAVAQYDVAMRLYTMRRGGAHYMIGFPDEATAARVDEVLAAAGVTCGLSCQLTTWDEALAFYQRARSSDTYFTWFTKRPWRLPLVIAGAMAALVIVIRASLVVTFFSPWQSSSAAMVIPARITGHYVPGLSDTTYTSTWATFAVPSVIAQAEIRSNGTIRLSAPPCTFVIGAPRTPPYVTNYLAFAPAVLTTHLWNPALFHPAMTNLVASVVDQLQSAWLAKPLSAWRLVVARPTVFWAHCSSQMARRALQDADTVTLVNTPHVNGIIYYAWEGSTARVAHVLLQDHERARMTSATLRVPPAARGQLTRAATAFAASFQFVSPHQSCP